MIVISEKNCRGVRLPAGRSRRWIIDNCAGSVRAVMPHKETGEVIFDFDVKDEWWLSEQWNDLTARQQQFPHIDITVVDAFLHFENASDAMMFKLTFGGSL